MKNILIFIFVLHTFASYGQDTIYYDKDGIEVIPILETYQYFEVIERDWVEDNKVKVTTYFKSGERNIEEHFSSYKEKQKILDGKFRKWYENGQLKQDVDYEDGKLHGVVLTYWADGQAKRIDSFERGKLISGKCFNAKGEAVVYYNYVVRPEFPGGIEKLSKYLRKSISYPKTARKNNIEGKVIVRFVVDSMGNISQTRVLKSAGVELDWEAVRVIREMPKWKPGIDDGEAVNVFYTLPISFTLRT